MGDFVSDTCEKGIKLLWFQCNKSLFFKGIEYLKEAILEGDPSAYYFLGRCYYWEEGGIKENKNKAIELYQKGGILGCPRCIIAINNSGIPLNNVKYNINKSLRMLIDMAEYGDGCASYQLGYTYYNKYITININNDKIEAFKWFKNGADFGHILCMKKTADCYSNGNGTVKNINRAYVYIEKAAQFGDSDCQYKMGLYYENNKELEKAFYYFTKADENGDIKASGKIGDYYAEGIITDKDNEKAFKCYSKAANNGDVYSQNKLGNCYLNGIGIELDKAKAFYWYNKAAEASRTNSNISIASEDFKINNVEAIANEAFCYINGYGCDKNISKAIKTFEELAENYNNAFSCKQLCILYRNGIDVKKDILKALEYCKKGAELKDEWCIKELSKFKKNIFGKLTYKNKT